MTFFNLFLIFVVIKLQFQIHVYGFISIYLSDQYTLAVCNDFIDFDLYSNSFFKTLF